MNFFKRALTSITRQWVKTMILFSLVFLLGIFLTGAMVTYNAIAQTEYQLFAQLPPVAQIEAGGDFDTIQEYFWETGIDPMDRVVPPDTLREIGSLPYVANFDISLRQRLWNEDIQLFGGLEWMGAWYHIGISPMPTFGVNNHQLMDIQEGIIGLVDGRTFTEEEMGNAERVAVISQPFAELNRLEVGSILSLESRVYIDELAESLGTREAWLNRENIIEYEEIQLEIIGIYEVLIELDFEPGYINYQGVQHEGMSWEEIRWLEQQNSIYVPIQLMESMPTFDLYGSRFRNRFDSFFVLHDPFDLASFTDVANELLPLGWEIVEPTAYLNRMLTSMEGMRGIADLILWGTVGASTVILMLTILLFLRDRRHEIGTYLALGESRKKVSLQVSLETILISLSALFLSFFTGNILAGLFSRRMLEQDLVAQIARGENHFMGDFTWHITEMSVTDMMAQFDVSIGFVTLLLICVMFILAVLLATATSIWYIFKLNPKEILM